MADGVRLPRWAWALSLPAAASLQFARALEGSLLRLHKELAEGAGYSRLASGSAEEAFTVWNEGVRSLRVFDPLGPRTIVALHVAADTIFVVCAIGALAACLSVPEDTTMRGRLHALWQRFWGRLAILAAALGVLVNAGELWVANAPCCRDTLGGYLQWLWIGERALVGIFVVILLASNGRLLSRMLGYVARSRAVLRVLLAAVLAFVLLLSLGPIGVQSEDVVEHWFKGHPWHGPAALAAYLAFVLVLWLGRFLVPRATTVAGGKVVVIGLLVTVVGIAVYQAEKLGRGAGMVVLGVIVLAAGLFELWLPPAPINGTDLPGPLVRGAVASIPALAVGLLLIRSGANVAVVREFWVAARLGMAGAAALGLGVAAWQVCRSDPEPSPTSETTPVARVAYACVAAVAVALSVVVDLWLAAAIGSFALVFLFLAAVAAVGLGLRSGFLSVHSPKLFLKMGFRRTPVFGVLVVWIAIASAVNGSRNGAVTTERLTYYDARIIDRMDSPLGTAVTRDLTDCQSRTAGVEAAEVKAAFCEWVAARTTESPTPPTVIPLVLVTASGGGVRAAAWTEKVLDCLFLRDDPVACADDQGAQWVDRWPSLFAANGASGGSVGIASAVAERLSHQRRLPDGTGALRWYRDQQRKDTLAPLLAHALVRDSLLGIFGVFVGEDRAASLEDAWAERWSDKTPAYCLKPGETSATSVTALGFMTLRDRCAGAVPLLLFNGTDVNTGRRVNLAPGDLDDTEAFDPLAPHDLDDYLGAKQDLPLFTAAFLSARFPFVTPSGRLPSCRAPGDRFERTCPPDLDAGGRALNVVDGGYAENSGTAQVLELWSDLEPLVAAYNDSEGGARVKVVVVEIENGELGSAPKPRLAAPGGELFAPFAAILGVAQGARGGGQDALHAAFPECSRGSAPDPASAARVRFPMYEHPGRTLPLGWTLSETSLGAVEDQFAAKANRKAAACFQVMVSVS